MFQLEKYHGSKSRYTCPSCGARQTFARYINTDTGEYLSPNVGRCNRESKCSYHFTPRDFFDANPEMKLKPPRARVKTGGAANEAPPSEPDYIDFDFLRRTLANYEANALVQFLFDILPENPGAVRQAVKDYFLGTTRDGKTVFWQIDQQKKVRTGKIIAYDSATGKRRKDIPPTWAHSELKRAGILKQDFNLMQCFFGEHLTAADQRPAAIVEAEKTAVIASIFYPQTVWLAAGAKTNLKAEKLKRLGDRRIILYPDADSFAEWWKVAQEARNIGLTVNVSAVIENRATAEQKANGYDLADYVIEEQEQIIEFNAFADKYNLAVDSIIENEALLREFDRAIDSEIEGLMRVDKLTRFEAESKALRPENIRQIVYEIATIQ